MQNAILYQAYGGPDFVDECRYSILKYLQVYNLTPPALTAVVIYTDAPEAFADFQPFLQELVVRPVSKQQVTQWRGESNFVHRVKIEMLIDLLQSFTGNVLYCDTDTYITAPIEPVFEALEKGAFFLHQYEGVIDKRSHPTFHKWEKFLSAATLQYNNKTVVFDKTLKMFNAGVVGLNSRSKELLQDVLALTDAVYQKFPKHIAEQFAFSYCMQKAGTINTADDKIAHYWNLKEFRQLLKTFFTVNAEESVPNLIKKLHHLDAMAIQVEKNAYKSLPFFQKFVRNLSGRAWKIEAYAKRL